MIIIQHPSDPDIPLEDNFISGYMDKNGLRMVKSFEGFAMYPYNIGDGTNTIGYGCTEVYSPDAYNQLYPSCTEEQASIVLGQFAYTNYSLPYLNQLNEDNYNWGYMTQDLFNAMVSFAWNSGVYAMKYDWSELWNLIITGQNITNPTYFAEVWANTNVMPGTEFEQGLRNRRYREGQIAIGNYDYTNFIISNVSVGGTITTNNGYGYIPREYQ